MLYYLPSCNFTRSCPETSKLIQTFLKAEGKVQVLGCCRKLQFAPGKGDTVFTVCQTCAINMHENYPDAEEKSIFEYLLDDPDFVWPDLKGEKLTVQDCWRARNAHGLQKAVRDCIRRMNAEVVELPENERGENCTFDGTWLFRPVAEGNLKLMPETFSDIRDHYVELIPEEEQKERMIAHAALYQTDRVVAYCNACLNGIRAGGAKGVHLLELMMGH